MRMLKRTSKHHQPVHLAGAVALGLVAGLVPKANLLAVGLYALLLVLPVHTLLALAVSVLVACAANYFDPITHVLGSWLLRQSTLQPLWRAIDNAAILPWLGLHNTVVLGSLISGATLAGPTYALTFRFFDRMRSRSLAPQPGQFEEAVILAPQPAEQRTVPPPKLAGAVVTAASSSIVQSSDAVAEEAFEPARGAVALINSWHMEQAAHHRLQSHTLVTTTAHAGQANTHVSQAASPQPQSPTDFIKADDRSTREMSEARPIPACPTPHGSDRSEIVDSLDLAHSAGEVLAWVDEMLEDCLSEDRAQTATRITDGRASEHPAAKALANDVEDNGTSSELANVAEHHDVPEYFQGEDRWLMETTIEVVRWGDGTPPNIQPPLPTEIADRSDAANRDSVQPQATDPSAAVSTTPTASHSVSNQTPIARVVQPRDAESDEAGRDDSLPSRMNIVPFIQRTSQAKRAAEVDLTHDQADALDPQQGERLGYLLGHLRQEREGRSS